jgi:hypothetical protein
MLVFYRAGFNSSSIFIFNKYFYIFRFREICILRARIRNARLVIVVRNREGGGCLV